MFNCDINITHDLMVNNSFVFYKHYVCLPNTSQQVNFLFMSLDNEICRIEAALKHKEMTIPELQRALKIQSQHWTNWKKRGIPGNRLIQISETLCVPPEWIAKGKNPPKWLDQCSIDPNQNDLTKAESNAEQPSLHELHHHLTPIQINLKDSQQDIPDDIRRIIDDIINLSTSGQLSDHAVNMIKAVTETSKKQGHNDDNK